MELNNHMLSLKKLTKQYCININEQNREKKYLFRIMLFLNDL